MANFPSKPDKQPYSTCHGVCDKLDMQFPCNGWRRKHVIEIKKVGVVVEEEEDSGLLFLNIMTKSF